MMNIYQVFDNSSDATILVTANFAAMIRCLDARSCEVLRVRVWRGEKEIALHTATAILAKHFSPRYKDAIR